jgi:spore coat protein U-like protein
MNKTANGALAAVLTGTLALSGVAHASPGCSLSNFTGLNFGAYDPLSAEPVVTAGSVDLCCEELGDLELVRIGISAGDAAGGSEGRAMSMGASRLRYELYQDPALTRVWGDGLDGTGLYGPVRPRGGRCSAISIYGYMPALQRVQPGLYSDTLMLTLAF